MTPGVLSELRGLEAKGHESEKLVRAANLLLRRQFLFAGDHGATQAYDVIADPRFHGYFSALFDALGYSLRRDTAQQWVGILPDAEAAPLATQKVDETIVLLLLALVWQESVNDGEVEERAVVVTTSDAIFDRYIAVVGKERLRETRFREILDLLKRRGLVSYGDRDAESGDMEIEIRPMVRLVVGENAVDRLQRFARETAATLEAAERRAAMDDAAAAVAAGTSDGDGEKRV